MTETKVISEEYKEHFVHMLVAYNVGKDVEGFKLDFERETGCVAFLKGDLNPVYATPFYEGHEGIPVSANEGEQLDIVFNLTGDHLVDMKAYISIMGMILKMFK